MSPANLPSLNLGDRRISFRGQRKGGHYSTSGSTIVAGKHRVGRDLGEELVAVSLIPIGCDQSGDAPLFRGEAMPPPDR